jgi:hypothetical protein
VGEAAYVHRANTCRVLTARCWLLSAFPHVCFVQGCSWDLALAHTLSLSLSLSLSQSFEFLNKPEKFGL